MFKPKLLAMETTQYLKYYHSRYQQVIDYGIDLYVLNGVGTEDFWPEDHYRLVGSKVLDDVVSVAKEWHADEQFDGVITFSESTVLLFAAVADALGLPSIGVDAARASRNKHVMRQSHRAAGAPIPSFALVESADDCVAKADEWGYPIIIKPTLGAGSHLVFRVDDEEHLRERFDQVQRGMENLFWVNSEPEGIDLGPVGILAESFLDGREILMEASVWDGEVYLGDIVDRITVEGDTFDDDVHHAPSTLTSEELAAVQAAVTTAIRGQGLRRSVVHAEVRFHDGKPYVLEIAARVGGGPLDEVSRITGDHCPIKAVVDIGLGRRPDLRPYSPTGVHTMSMALVSDAGVVREVHVPDAVRDDPRVFMLKITACPGDLIRRPPDGNTIVGFLGTQAIDFESAQSAMEDLAGQITVDFQEQAHG